MVKVQRILLKKGRKKAPNFSHQEFRRVEKSRVQRLETAQSHSLIAYLKKTSSWEPTIARTIRTYIKNMATLLNARRSPTVRLLSGIGSSMSFCQRTGPQKTMTKKQNGPADCSASPFTLIKNIKNFYTNVHTNKLDLLPEFESISGTPLWYFISHFCPYTSILSHFSGSCKEPYHLT